MITTKKLLLCSLLIWPSFLMGQAEKKEKKVRVLVSHSYYFKVENGEVIRLYRNRDSYYQEMDSSGRILVSRILGRDSVLRINSKRIYSSTGKLLSDSFFNSEGKHSSTIYCTYDQQDRPLLSRWSGGSLTMAYFYDSSGGRILNTYDTVYGASKKTQYLDKAGRVIKEDNFGKDGKRYRITMLRYDQAGNEIENLSFDKDSVFENGSRVKYVKGYEYPVEEYTYGEKGWQPVFVSRLVNGIIVERKNYDESGSLLSTEHFTYDEKKRMIRARVISKGKPDYITTYKYDARGDKVEIICMEGKVLDMKYNMKYVYNEWGDLIFVERYIGDKPAELEITEYVYY